MINIYPTFDKTLIKSIVTEPELFKLTYGQQSKADKWEPDETIIYMLAESDNDIIGLFPIKEGLSQIIVEAECLIRPKYWGTGKSVEAALAGFEWLKQNTKFKRIMTNAPDVAIHSIQYIQKMGFHECGAIKDGIIYNNQYRTLFLFERSL